MGISRIYSNNKRPGNASKKQLLVPDLDLDSHPARALPHMITDLDGQLASLESLINEPKPHHKFISAQSANTPPVHQVPDFLEHVCRQATSGPNFLHQKIQDIEAWVILRRHARRGGNVI
jgi:hypothetical protein